MIFGVKIGAFIVFVFCRMRLIDFLFFLSAVYNCLATYLKPICSVHHSLAFPFLASITTDQNLFFVLEFFEMNYSNFDHSGLNTILVSIELCFLH